jgi:hypothetical protein
MQLTLEKLADLPMFAQLQSAFVYSMLFNVGAAAVASRLLLRMAAPAQQA